MISHFFTGPVFCFAQTIFLKLHHNSMNKDSLAYDLQNTVSKYSLTKVYIL